MAQSKREASVNTHGNLAKAKPQSEHQIKKLYHAPRKLPLAQSLLARAYSPDTAAAINTESIQRRPLHLHATSKDVLSIDARTQRQRGREAKAAALRRRNRKPRPISAATKRKLCLYEIPKSQQKWDIFVPLHRLWTGYIRDVLGWSNNSNRVSTTPNIEAKVIGPLIASADLHGAQVEVVRSRCVGRVGIAGIIVKDTKETFEIVTRKNELKIVPKECTTFRIQVPLQELDASSASTDAASSKAFVAVELLGSQFAHRPAERATRKLKIHLPPDI